MYTKHLVLAFLAIAGLIYACAGRRLAKDFSNQHPFPDFSYEGHRGARGLYPENTIGAMYTALNLGVTTLEMDVQISQDSQVIVAHDAYFNPKFARLPDGQDVTDKKQFLYRLPYAQIQQYDVGSRPHPDFPEQVAAKVHIPLLLSLIDSVEQYAVRNELPRPYYNIETKLSPSGDGQRHPDPETFVQLLMDVINKKDIASRVVIQSFDPRTLKIIHRDYPHTSTSLLSSDSTKTVHEQVADLGFIPFIFSPQYGMVDAKMVQQCHDMGMRIIPWTVNDTTSISRLKALQVDGIISDYPNLFKLNPSK